MAKDYFGAKNVCLVYDKNGFLLPNADGILSDTLTKNLIVRHPTKANTYFLFSRSSTDGQLRRTTIEKVNGNYEVTAKNVIIPTNGAIGAHFTAIEDQNQNQILLYATRGNLAAKKAELIVIALTDNATSAPILLASLDYPETDAYKGGELQISPDGKQLLWYHLGERLAWFDVQEMKPTTFLLGLGGTTVTQIPLGSNVVDFTQTAYASIDIDKNNDLFFTQKTLQNIEKIYKNGILPPAKIAGDVRRGKDDVIQGLVRQFGFGLPVQVHTRTNKLSSQPAQVYVSRLLRVRSFELKDHLGNIRVMVEDQKQADASAKIQSYSNYYAFGMEMPGLQYADNQAYRYGFNGKENDKDFGTAGLTQDYGFRLYNPAIAKFLSVDPLTKSYPWYTPYQFAGNMPIHCIDLDGLEEVVSNKDGTLTVVKPKIEPPLAKELINVKPIAGGYLRVSSAYKNIDAGYKRDDGEFVHGANDYGCVDGTPVFAVADGVVGQAGPSIYGPNQIAIDHGVDKSGKTLSTQYSHLLKMEVKIGARVKAGDKIGTSGKGHLHFQLNLGYTPLKGSNYGNVLINTNKNAKIAADEAIELTTNGVEELTGQIGELVNKTTKYVQTGKLVNKYNENLKTIKFWQKHLITDSALIQENSRIKTEIEKTTGNKIQSAQPAGKGDAGK